MSERKDGFIMKWFGGSARRWLAGLLALTLLSGMKPAAAQEVERFFLSEGYSREINVPGFGNMQYYAQNDPMWIDAIYEPYDSGYRRTMMESGCVPTTAAMALANLLTLDELTILLEHARSAERGYSFCPYSVNGLLHKTDDHHLYYPKTGIEFLTYLPMIIAAYATGNNDRNLYYRLKNSGGTNINLLKGLAYSYGLEYSQTSKLETACEKLASGSTVVTTAVSGPFTKQSHFLLLVGVKDGWVYVLDPYMRETYEYDSKGYLDVIEPGLVRFRASDNDAVHVYSYYIFTRPGSD